MDSLLNVNLNLYRSFYYVAKYKGFSKASQYAFISQPSLSTNIKNLEDALNTKLFYRGKNYKEIILTSEGKELYSKLEEIITVLNSDSEKEELNIGCTRVIADNYLGKVITNFKNKYNNIKIGFKFDNNTELYQLLRKEEIDIIISRYPMFYKFDKSICVEKIIDIENVIVCSRKFYEKNKKKMNKKGYRYPMILPNTSEKRRNIEQYLIDCEVNYSIEVEIPNSNLLKELISSGVGVGYINKEFVRKELEDGDFVILENFKNIPFDNITLIYNSMKTNHTLQEFVKLLKNTIRKTNS